MPQLDQHTVKPARVEMSSSAPARLTDKALDLAAELSRIHGTIRVATESSGVHFYMASPACLEEDGEIELTKMHLAVNATKFLEKQKDRCALCMKTETAYAVSELLAMEPLDQRGFNLTPKVVRPSVVDRSLMDVDHMGRLIPRGPGEVIPVTELPQDHPAISYLRWRKFDPAALYKQFRLSYCEKERGDVYYRDLMGGFKASPQGRLVFFIDVEGCARGWQARIMEVTNETEKFYWHPYRKDWVPVADRVGEGWQPKPGWEGFDPVKYMIGLGAKRNSALMGLDSAVAANAYDSKGRRYCFLTEGAFDAGRLGPASVAMMGKFLSNDQADLIAKYFARVIFVRDNDEAGGEAVKKVTYQFKARLAGARIGLDIVAPPRHRKDPGEMTAREVEELKKSVL